MKLLVVISALVVACSARPEPPAFNGYPGASGGLPPSGGPGFSSYAPSGGAIAGPPASVYGAPTGPGGLGGPSGPSGPGIVGDVAPTIHKHVYVHVPPPEQEEPRPRKVYPTRTPQKHYKIVFIKAPTPPAPTAPELPPVVQDEQKTLIYVLVKRPDEAPEIQIPTPAPTKPSKPEVYFIRYKTQKGESEGGQAGYPAAGPPAGASFPSGGGSSFGGSAGGGSYSGPISGSAPSNAYGPPSGGSF